MSNNFIVKKCDKLGRFVIPEEYRQQLEIEPDNKLEVSVEGNSLVIKKHEPGCVFCGGTDTHTFFNNKPICKKCLKELIHKDEIK